MTNFSDFVIDDATLMLGPYEKLNSRGRKFVVLYDTITRQKKTMPYARYLYLTKVGNIPDGMEVDHVNNDPSDDRVENYQLLSKDDNNYKKSEFLGYHPDGYTFNCPVCGTERTIKFWIYAQNQLRGNSRGPYCSRSCANSDRG